MKVELKRDDVAIENEIKNGSKIQCTKQCRFYMGKNVCGVLTDNEGGVQNRCTFYQTEEGENDGEKQ